MKNLLAGEKNRTKKNATKKMTTPMPMGRKQKKWMGLYMTLVLIATVGATTVFAAGDPLSVINNLSTFIFSLIRDKRKGKNTCGCNCAHCAMAGSCHGQKKK